MSVDYTATLAYIEGYWTRVVRRTARQSGTLRDRQTIS